MLTRCLLALALLPAPGAAASGAADEAPLPAGSIVHVSVPDGAALWETPLGAAVEELLADNPDVDGLRAHLRGVTGLEAGELARRLLGGAVDVAVYRSKPSRLGDDAGDGGGRRVLVVSRGEGVDALDEALDRTLSALEGLGVPVKSGDYRGLEYTRLGDAVVAARLGDRLLLSDHDELLADALDRALDASVGDPRQGRRARKASRARAVAPDAAGAVASFSVRFPSPLTRRGGVRGVGEIAGRVGNRLSSPLLSVLLDDAADALGAGGRLVGHVESDGDRLTVQARLLPDPDDVAAVDAAVSRTGRDDAPAPFRVPVDAETLGVLHVHRDLADWWRHREERMPPEIQTRLARFDSTMSMLFAGQSLADDVFAQLGSSLAVVFDRQVFADADAPDIRMPAACLVADLRDAARFAPMLQGAFQTFIGLINADRGQQGEAPFLIETERVDGGLLVSAGLMEGLVASGPMDDATDPGMDGGMGGAPYSANLSPTMAVFGDRLLLGTSAEQVRRLGATLQRDGRLPRGDGHEAVGELGLSVDADRLEAALRDNRKALIANNVLEEGNDPMQAAEEIDGLIALVQRLSAVEVGLTHDEQGLRARLGLTFDAGTR